MKRFLSFAMFLFMVLFLSAASADDSRSTIQQLFDAERILLFETDNVTLTGHAEISIDGILFKTADLKHVQDGIISMRDWLVTNPLGDCWPTETGYTVVAYPNITYAYESHGHAEKHYYVEESRQHDSILRHTVTGNTLIDLCDSILEQNAEFGSCTSTVAADGQTTITISVKESEIPEIVQSLLNALLQYGTKRYYGYDYADDNVSNYYGHYTYYGTITQGLIYCLREVRLTQLQATATLDANGALKDVYIDMSLAYLEKNGQYTGEIHALLEEHAFDYGISAVSADPREYGHWAEYDETDDDYCDTVEDYAYSAWIYEEAPYEKYEEAQEVANAYVLKNKYLTEDEINAAFVYQVYCSGYRDISPISSPWWIVRYEFSQNDVFEVWLNDDMTVVTSADRKAMYEKARAAWLIHKPMVEGNPVTLQMVDSYPATLVYLFDSHQWVYTFYTSMESSWQIYISDTPEMTIEDVVSTNG